MATVDTITEKSDTWKDSKGREWTARLTLAIARKLRDAYRLDLLDQGTWPALGGLLADLDRLGNVLWEVHREQAEAVGIDREGFNAGLDFDALNAGFWAIGAAYCFFFPASRRAGLLTMLELEVEAMEEFAVELVRQRAGTTTVTEFKQAVKDELAATLG